MNQPNKYADWFRRCVWVGILLNLFFAIAAILFPHKLIHWLGFAPATDTVWLRDVGMLLMVLNLFYMPVASAPFRYAVFARLTVAARFIPAFFFLWVMRRVPHSGSVRILFWTDLILGIVLAFLLFRAFRFEDSKQFVMRRSFISRFFGGMWRFINGTLGIRWHWLYRLLGSMNLWAIRTDLREHNLHDTSQLTSQGVPPLEDEPDHLIYRTPDGSHNDLQHPRMGRAGERFGRNAAHDLAWPDQDNLMCPNPREVSLRLMTREEFIPATTLNLLAAAWIQFQNHGWFNHARDRKRLLGDRTGRGRFVAGQGWQSQDASATHSA